MSENKKKNFSYHGRQFIPLIHEFQLELCDIKFEEQLAIQFEASCQKHKYTQLVNIPNSCMGIFRIVKQVSWINMDILVVKIC